MAETLTGERAVGESRRSYPIVEGPAEPAELFGRLARAGISLRRSGLFLVAEVSDGATRARDWPALDRLLARHAASLAATATLARRFAARWSPERVSALLVELRPEVPEILRETAGGEERLEELIAGPRNDPDAALACVVCCRGLAIRALRDGRPLAGLLAGGDGDGRGRGRRRHRATRTGDGSPWATGSGSGRDGGWLN